MQLETVLAETLRGSEHTPFGAVLRTRHRRPVDFDEKTKLYRFRRVDDDEVIECPKWSNEQIVEDVVNKVKMGLLSEESAHNLVLNVGRVLMHKQCYGTSSLGTNGLNYVALTNTAVTPAAADTTLSGEITTNGLGRVQGTVTLASGSGNQTTVDKTFTCATSAQAAQAAALFDASSSGNMNHEVTFTQRSLQVGDTLQTTYTLTLG